MPTPALARPVAKAAAASRGDGGPSWDPVKTAMRTSSELTAGLGVGCAHRVHWTRARLDRRLDHLRPGPPPLGPRRCRRPLPPPGGPERLGGPAPAPRRLVAPRRPLGYARRRAARGRAAGAGGAARGAGGART